MKIAILMALETAERLTDEGLAEAIAELESGRRKLRLRDDYGRPFPLAPIFLAVYRRVQRQRIKPRSG